MYFSDEKHATEFKQLGKTHDNEYLAAYYILTADEELRRKAARYIKTDGINWEGIWNQDWSSGYALLLKLAQCLFQSSGSVDLAYGLKTWDDERFNLAMQAIYIRRNGVGVE